MNRCGKRTHAGWPIIFGCTVNLAVFPTNMSATHLTIQYVAKEHGCEPAAWPPTTDATDASDRGQHHYHKYELAGDQFGRVCT